MEDKPQKKISYFEKIVQFILSSIFFRWMNQRCILYHIPLHITWKRSLKYVKNITYILHSYEHYTIQDSRQKYVLAPGAEIICFRHNYRDAYVLFREVIRLSKEHDISFRSVRSVGFDSWIPAESNTEKNKRHIEKQLHCTVTMK